MEGSFPESVIMTLRRSPVPLVENRIFPLLIILILISGYARAICAAKSITAELSALSDFINFSLAGVLKKRSLTIIVVPSGHPVGTCSFVSPPWITVLLPVWLSFVFVITSILETDEILAKASPRNPSVSIYPRSSALCILLVACL